MQNIYPNSWSSCGFFYISARGQLITNSTYIMYVQGEPSWRDQCNKDLFSVDGGASVLVLNESHSNWNILHHVPAHCST